MRGHHSGSTAIAREALQAEALRRDQQSIAANTTSQANTRSRFSRPVTVFHISQTEPVSGVPP